MRRNAIGASLTFSLDPAPPFRLDLTVWTLRRSADNQIDRWNGRAYQRILALDSDVVVTMAVAQFGSPDAPRLLVTLSGTRLSQETKGIAKATLERLLGLNVDLSAFYRFAETDAQLGPLVQRFRGVKPPRLPTIVETLDNAIACQQITLTQGIRLLNRLTQAYGLADLADLASSDGRVIPDSGSVGHAFPRPQDMVALDPQDLMPLGFSANKARALLEHARAICDNSIDLESLAELDDDVVLSRLLSLRGIGRWTAEYTLLRGLGRTHIFPGDDVGGRKTLQRWLGLTQPLDYAGVRQTIANWKSYGGLIYFHLL
jgi:DNA-3-methyladenine glycosylase II